MKRLYCILILLTVAASLQAGMSAADFSIGFQLGKDGRKWTTPQMRGEVEEFVPQGDSLEAWKERVCVQVVITRESMRSYLDSWKRTFPEAGSRLEI